MFLVFGERGTSAHGELRRRNVLTVAVLVPSHIPVRLCTNR